MVKVCFFGDSLTSGMVAATSDQYYPPSLIVGKAQAKWTVVNEGVPGDYAAEMPSRLNSFLRDSSRKHRGKVDYVVFLGGTNDLRMGRESEEVIADLLRICEICRTHDASLIMLTIPPNATDSVGTFAAKRELVNEAIVGKINEQGNDVVDISAALPFGEDGMFGDDGVHLTRKGYKRVGELVLQALRRKHLNGKAKK
mmetsp:Transcript_19104/g.39790  ORF Transcript_19104/g.39790 Transcript_19104/m.39790 type:complete len:198 (+) Transcript_19104:69-662(+)